jgi:hypothetical protein
MAVQSGDLIAIERAGTLYKATAGDVVVGKQDTLVSGTNIKTINGTSVLGSGNISISGGGGGASPILSWVI